MLLETLAPATTAPPTFTEPTEAGPAGGIVTLIIVPDKQPPVLLWGKGPDWFTQDSTLYLTPFEGEKLPIWYSFILQMNPEQSYKLLGALVYAADVPADAKANLYYPVASDGTVTLNLMHDLRGTQSVSYMLEIGYTDGTNAIWIPDPTITFEPQG